MRLLNIERLEMVEFLDDQEIPGGYAIASHRWLDGGEETSFQDVKNGWHTDKEGYKKVVYFAEFIRSRLRSIKWLWIDTCCINKHSDPEVTLSINSMYRWYSKAEICLAYLQDVDKSNDMNQVRSSVWFTRGWTLQELIAPPLVVFLNEAWQVVGRKGWGQYGNQWPELKKYPALEPIIADITGIPEAVLCNGQQISNFSIDEVMEWADERKTRRPEDLSYCLFGLLQIAIPANYGEGANGARWRIMSEYNRVRGIHELDPERLPMPSELVKLARNGQKVEFYNMLRRIWLALQPLDLSEETRDELLSIVQHHRTWSEKTALHYAAANGWKHGVNMLIECGAQIDAISARKETPLYKAALRGRTSIVRILLAKGAQVASPANASTTKMKTALYAAVRGKTLDCIDLIAKKTGDVEQYAMGHFTSRAVLLATLDNQPDILEMVVRTIGLSQPGYTDRLHRRALFSAVYHGNLQNLQLLMERKIDLNISDTCSRGGDMHHIVHEAIESKNLDIVEVLLSREEIILSIRDLVDLHGRTALDLAKEANDQRIYDALKQAGCTPAQKQGLQERIHNHVRILKNLKLHRGDDSVREASRLLREGVSTVMMRKLVDLQVALAFTHQHGALLLHGIFAVIASILSVSAVVTAQKVASRDKELSNVEKREIVTRS